MTKDLPLFGFNRPTDMSSKNRQALMHTSLFSDLLKDITFSYKFWLAYGLIPFWLQRERYCSNIITTTNLPATITPVLQKSQYELLRIYQSDGFLTYVISQKGCRTT